MKKRNLVLSVMATCLVSCFLLSGCNGQKQIDSETVKTVKVEEQAHLQDDTVSPTCQITIDYSYLAKSDAADSIVPVSYTHLDVYKRQVVSMLPLGHVFGMTFDFLYGFTAGAHLWFLTRMPSPKIIAESFAEIRPRVIACVPLIVEKIFKKNILPKVDNKLGKLLLHVPIISDKIKELIKQKAMEVFGGNFIEIIIGGAPFNAEVEAFLKMIDFPYTIAYGMTECGPIICHSHWTELKLASCGKVAARMEAKVLSPNPSAIAGELVCRGANLMLGYYKNEEATRQVIDTEGWLHTGDMATIDENGNVFIKGRCKNLLLTSSGQNIYPEEIESKLNNMPYVSESLIILQQDKLVGLIYPDSDDAFAHGLNQSDLVRVMEENRLELNKQLPAFSQIARFKLYPEEFEKTAKKSIKRFLYQDIKE